MQQEIVVLLYIPAIYILCILYYIAHTYNEYPTLRIPAQSHVHRILYTYSPFAINSELAAGQKAQNSVVAAVDRIRIHLFKWYFINDKRKLEKNGSLEWIEP
jgi:hypothetical protein